MSTLRRKCCCGCVVCNAQCVQLNFIDWVGYSQGIGGAIDVDPITYLNGKDFKLKLHQYARNWCHFTLDCAINELIEIEPGLTVHYQRLVLYAFIYKDADDKLNVQFGGALFDDDFGTGATDRNIYLRGATFEEPAVAETPGECFEEIEYQIPGEEPEDPSPYPDAFAHIQVLDGVSRDDCTTEGCTDPQCADCCPDTTCIHLHITRAEFTYPPTGATFAAADFDLYLIRGIDGEGNGTCSYSGQCIIRSEGVAIGVTYGWAHVVCDDEGNPLILFLRFHYTINDPVGTAHKYEIFELQTDGGGAPLAIGCDSTTDIAGDLKHYAAIGGSGFVEITTPAITADLTTSETCDTPGDCTSEWLYRQARICDGALVDLWAHVSVAASYPGFRIGSTCYEWDAAESPTHGTLLDVNDIDQVAPCETCGCDDGCHECAECPEFCADEGKASLAMHVEIPGGECGSCATYGGPTGEDGCRRCSSCEPDPVTGQPDALPECIDYDVASDAACLAHDPPGYIYCDEGCVGDGAVSPCSWIAYIADLSLPLTSHTSTTMTFGDTVSLGIYGNMDVEVVFHCDTLTYDFSFTIDGRDGATNRCVAERSIDEGDGAGVTCNGIAFGFNIDLEDTTLETTCTGNGVSVSGVSITREGC